MRKRNVQNEILTKLLGSEGLKYSQARPAQTENDLYNYHLQFLVNKGLVSKFNDLYHLTDDGKKYIEEKSPLSRKGGVADLFRISVLLLVTKDFDGETKVILQTRKRHPFWGDTGIPSGKVLKEEKITEAAKRKLFEETSLKCEFKPLGLLRQTRYKDKRFFSDSFWFLCESVNDPIGLLEEDNEHGKNFWASLDQAIDYENKSIGKSELLIRLFKDLKDKGNISESFLFFEEIEDLPTI